eukprot:5084064-Pyramimonas_sp.AAC.2
MAFAGVALWYGDVRHVRHLEGDQGMHNGTAHMLSTLTRLAPDTNTISLLSSMPAWLRVSPV